MVQQVSGPLFCGDGGFDIRNLPCGRRTQLQRKRKLRSGYYLAVILCLPDKAAHNPIQRQLCKYMNLRGHEIHVSDAHKQMFPGNENSALPETLDCSLAVPSLPIPEPKSEPES